MERVCFILHVCIMFLFGFSGAITVQQSPSSLFRKLNDDVQLTCQHGDSSYYTMLWYQQAKGKQSLELVGFLVHAEVTQDEKYKGKFNLTGNGNKRGSLLISQLSAEAHISVQLAGTGDNDPAYFGEGTKLTVLEKNDIISEPKVKILPPSKKEIKLKKNATLVCVATDFYPDHVSIAWKINNRNETRRFKTDESAIRPDKFSNYSITSRLRVTEKEWHNTRNKFHCSVSFFEGNKTIVVTATIQGIQYCGTTAEENKWSGNAAELSYILVLVKSALFALFLATFVWKLKGSSAAKFLD